MAPAFSSTKEAGAFALLLLTILLLPILVPKSALPPREQIYASLPWEVGPYPYIHRQIFEEKSDVDIAIMGSSRIWTAMDTPYLQQQLSEKLGRKAVVISLCWPWSGFDDLYFVAQDLLQHRKVHMIVFSDETGLVAGQNAPHAQAWRWFRFEDNAGALTGLPWRFQLSYYYGSVLGMPRNLLSLLRPNLPPVLTPDKLHSLEREHHWGMPMEQMGAIAMHVGYYDDPDLFERFTPEPWAAPPSAVFYSPATAAEFQFKDTPMPSLQLHFAKKFAALAQANGTKLACVNVPLFTEIKSPTIQEKYCWPDVMQSNVTLLGIPPDSLFEGMDRRDIEKLYWDTFHFNLNGQGYFTRLLAPSLIEIYDDPTKN